MATTAFEASLKDQLALLQEVAEEQGVGISHIKPHGALYHDLSHDQSLAERFLSIARAALPDSKITALAGSAFAQFAAENGFSVIAEGFADRRYGPDGNLVPRVDKNALIEDPVEQARQALSMVRGQPFTSSSGKALPMKVETICIHGDSANAVIAARAIKKALDTEGITIAAP